MISRRALFGTMAGGLAGGLALAVRTADAKAPDAAEVFSDPDAPVLGNPDGDVTMIEYFDYQCGYCKKYHPVVMEAVRDDGKIKLIMKDWPIFGDASVFAAQAALGASYIGGYSTALEALLKVRSKLTPQIVRETITNAGLDIDAIADQVNSHNQKISDLLTRNWNQAARFGFRGTPSFIIGKTAYPGALDKPALKAAIARARG